MIVDFHMHVFPDKLAPKVCAKLSAVSGIAPCSNLTLADTRRLMDEWGVSLGVLQHIATAPAQQHAVNDFAAACMQEGFLSFGSVHPLAEDALEELERIHALGLKGVKLHPAYQGFDADDPRAFPVYERAAQLNLPVLLHAGWDPISPGRIYAAPAQTAAVAKAFPTLKLICAHMGAMRQYEQVSEYLKLPNVWIDTSMSSVFLESGLMEKIIRTLGVSQVLFASDCPWSTVPAELKQLQQCRLSARELDAILCGNARALLNLT